jgi:hypothetical protein
VLAGWSEHGHGPEFLITDPADHDWPWTGEVRQVTGATVYALPKGFTAEKASRARTRC